MNNTTYTKILCKITIFLQMTSLTLPTLFKVLKYSKLSLHKVISIDGLATYTILARKLVPKLVATGHIDYWQSWQIGY